MFLKVWAILKVGISGIHIIIQFYIFNHIYFLAQRRHVDPSHHNLRTWTPSAEWSSERLRPVCFGLLLTFLYEWLQSPFLRLAQRAPVKQGLTFCLVNLILFLSFAEEPVRDEPQIFSGSVHISTTRSSNSKTVFMKSLGRSLLGWSHWGQALVALQVPKLAYPCLMGLNL